MTDPASHTLPLPAPLLPRILGVVLLALPAAVYGAFLASHAINVPTGDDYFAILDFLRSWHDPARTAGWSALFEQFYSHRQPFQRLLAVGLEHLTGQCDLRACVAVAWIGWGLLSASLLRFRWSGASSAWWLLPVPIILMQPQGESNLLIATGSPGHAWTLLFAWWACLVSRQPATTRQAGAMALATGSALCSANGLLLFPIIALRGLLRREWRPALAWLAAGGLAWIWYLAGYSFAAQPFAQQSFSLPGFLQNAAVMAGGIFYLGAVSLPLIGGAGLVLLGLAGWTTWRERLERRAADCGCFVLFLLLTVAMTAYARIGWPAAYMLQDRYRSYVVVLVAVLYLQLAGLLPPAHRLRLAILAIPAAVVFSLLSYLHEYRDVRFARRWAEATAMNLAWAQPMPMASAPEQAVEAGRILLTAVQQGRLRPPALLSPADIALIESLPGAEIPATPDHWRCEMNDDVLGYVLTADQKAKIEGVPDFGVLFQDGHPVILPVLQPRRKLSDPRVLLAPLGDTYAFALPATVFRPGSQLLFAMVRRPAGSLEAVWSARVRNP